MASIAQEIEEYIASYYEGNPDYPNVTSSEIRQIITEKLKSLSFFVNATKLDKDKMAEYDNPDVSNDCIKSGICLVNSHVDSGDFTNPVESGKYVCFDMSTGLHVTGINPTWPDNEYRIIGTALDSNPDEEFKLIRVKLIDHLNLMKEATRCIGDVEEVFSTDDNWIKVDIGTIYGIDGSKPLYMADREYIYVHNLFRWAGWGGYKVKFELNSYYTTAPSPPAPPDGVEEHELKYRERIWTAYQLECE